MGPKTPTPQTQQLFGYPLDQHLDLEHPLMDWAQIGKTFSGHCVSDRDRPALPPRLVAGLLYLQNTFDCSHALVIITCVENSYWQYFTGERYLQTRCGP